MSHWNHRVIKHTKTSTITGSPETETWFSIHEVFYDENGHPNGYTEDAVSPFGETLLELADDLVSFQAALSKPVLVHEDFFPTRESIHARDVEPDAVEADRIALNEAENAAWMALGGTDTQAQNSVKALLDMLQDGYDREHGTDSRIIQSPDIGTSASANELIEKLQRGFDNVEDIEDLFPREKPVVPEERDTPKPLKVFPVPSNRSTEAAQREPGIEIPCPFCTGRVLPRKEWLTGTWCCDKQYKARGLQSY